MGECPRVFGRLLSCDLDGLYYVVSGWRYLLLSYKPNYLGVIGGVTGWLAAMPCRAWVMNGGGSLLTSLHILVSSINKS